MSGTAHSVRRSPDLRAAVGVEWNSGRVTFQQREPEARESIRVEGVVTESLPNAVYRVKLVGGNSATAHVSEKLRMHVVRILPGDRVVLELSSFDLARGRILQRL